MDEHLFRGAEEDQRGPGEHDADGRETQGQAGTHQDRLLAGPAYVAVPARPVVLGHQRPRSPGDRNGHDHDDEDDLPAHADGGNRRGTQEAHEVDVYETFCGVDQRSDDDGPGDGPDVTEDLGRRDLFIGRFRGNGGMVGHGVECMPPGGKRQGNSAHGRGHLKSLPA